MASSTGPITRVYYVDLCIDNDICEKYTSNEIKTSLDNFMETIKSIKDNLTNPSYIVNHFNEIKNVFINNIELSKKICKLIYKMITTVHENPII